MGERIRIESADGFELGGYRATPTGTARATVIVIQEIFGVNSHIREVADGYAAEGYLAIAPQIFDRIEPDIELGYQQADMGRGIELAFQKLDHDLALQDVKAAIGVAPAGKVGVVGYCFGGLMTWRTACGVDGISAAVAYYGGGIAGETQREPRCPVMMHFGEKDAHISQEDVAAIGRAHPEVTIHVYPADHGFNCDQRGSYHQESAALAKQRSLEFFARNLA